MRLNDFEEIYTDTTVERIYPDGRMTAFRLIAQSPADGWFELNFGGYDPDFVQAIKVGIPGRARQWKPERGVWRVAPAFVLKLAEVVYPDYPVRIKTCAVFDTKGAREVWYRPKN